MPANTIAEQLTKYLTDAHSIEEQALVQMRIAPRLAHDAELAAIFRAHIAETEGHELMVGDRLRERGASPARLKDAAMKAGGVGFALFAAAQPDTPGKLTAHAFSYEHLELAAYELLMHVAQRAGDQPTAEVARRIRDEERAMAERLAGAFDRAVEASLAAVGPVDLDDQLTKYLGDAHAIEAQAIKLLERGEKIAGDPELAGVYRDHLDETREHQRLVGELLDAHGTAPSTLKDAALSIGALNWGAFFAAHPDTPGKLAAFAYAFEHLEIASYALLERVARRAGDERAVEVAARILASEHAAADRLAGSFDRAADASLQAQGVAA